MSTDWPFPPGHLLLNILWQLLLLQQLLLWTHSRSLDVVERVREKLLQLRSSIFGLSAGQPNQLRWHWGPVQPWRSSVSAQIVGTTRAEGLRPSSDVPQLRQKDEVEVGGEDGSEGRGQEETISPHLYNRHSGVTEAGERSTEGPDTVCETSLPPRTHTHTHRAMQSRERERGKQQPDVLPSPAPLSLSVSRLLMSHSLLHLLLFLFLLLFFLFLLFWQQLKKKASQDGVCAYQWVRVWLLQGLREHQRAREDVVVFQRGRERERERGWRCVCVCMIWGQSEKRGGCVSAGMCVNFKRQIIRMTVCSQAAETHTFRVIIAHTFWLRVCERDCVCVSVTWVRGGALFLSQLIWMRQFCLSWCFVFDSDLSPVFPPIFLFSWKFTYTHIDDTLPVYLFSWSSLRNSCNKPPEMSRSRISVLSFFTVTGHCYLSLLFMFKQTCYDRGLDCRPTSYTNTIVTVFTAEYFPFICSSRSSLKVLLDIFHSGVAKFPTR